MTGRHRSHWFAILLALAILSGCTTTTKTQSFAMSFLPSVPAAPPVPDLGEPPAIHPSMYSNETPNLIEKLATPASSDGETRIKRAEQRFEAGKRFYQQGETAAARTAFDQAVDI